MTVTQGCKVRKIVMLFFENCAACVQAGAYEPPWREGAMN